MTANSNFTSTQIVAKEGWLCIAVVFTLFLFMCVANFDIGAHILFIALLVLIFVYRNPERIAAEDDSLAILSAADGKITEINRKSEFGQNLTYIKINSSLSNVGMVRFPIDSTLLGVKLRHGLCLPQSSELGKILNEGAILKCSHKKMEYFIKLRVGAFCRKIHIGKTSGNFRAGSRIAFMSEGVVEMYLPANSRIKVSVGDMVKGGESVLGFFDYEKEIYGK